MAKSQLYSKEDGGGMQAGQRINELRALAAEEGAWRKDSGFYRWVENLEDLAVQGYDCDGRVFLWNDCSTLFYGYTVEEACGRNLFELILPKELRAFARAAVNTAARTGRMPACSKVSLLHKEGFPVSVCSYHFMISVPEGEPVFFCVDAAMEEDKAFGSRIRSKAI